MSSSSNPQYISLNTQIDALRQRLGEIVDAEWYDAQDYEQVAERMVSLENQRDELLAGILFDRYNSRFSVPISRERAIELATYANEQRDNRAVKA